LRLAALVSGGKDSIHAAALCETHGWSVECLITIVPEEKDSLLFHTPNLRWVPLLAEAWGKEHAFQKVSGKGEEAELLAIRDALAPIVKKGMTGVTVGAIASSYQWARVWHVAHELGLEVYAPFWRATPEELLREEIGAGMDIRIVEVASEPLGEDLLGKRMDLPLLDRLERMGREIRQFHISGEGGDYETLVLDAPFFSSLVEVQESHVERSGAKSNWVIDRARLVGKDI
jgi:ABC transporter with metal-binding/Fe-S-binding domain ATP-binding protein